MSMFAVTAWACVLPPLPLALAALLLEGPERLLAPVIAPNRTSTITRMISNS